MSQYFDNVDLKSNIVKHEEHIFNNTYYFNTDNGVFSKQKMDYGTRTLLETLPIASMSGEVLDVGCGYGVMGIILTSLTDIRYDGVDVNKRALHLAEMNAKLNKSSNVNFFESNCYTNVNKKYEYIITNPPIRAGKIVVYEILIGAKDYLNENGELYFVMRKDHGVKSALKDIDKYYITTILKKDKGFYVIKCVLR